MVHYRTGTVLEWEDLFVDFYGLYWRFDRDQFNTHKDWDRTCKDFVDRLCDSWELPRFRPDTETLQSKPSI